MKENSKSPAIALVTGAADRIGAVIAARLAAEGAKVVIHYHSDAEGASQLVDTIKAAGGQANALSADLTDPIARRGLIARAGALFGPLTILVNNASLFEPDAATDFTEELWDRHFDLHAKTPSMLARDFARQLPSGVIGNIINMIDERVLHLTPAYFSYTLSKAVLWQATRTLAQSLAPRIRVNAIGPGPTLKNVRQSAEDFQHSIDALPLQRGPTPDEIADAIAFLIGSPSMTGQLLALDGGEHLEFKASRGPTPHQP